MVDKPRKIGFIELPPEDSNFVPEVEIDESTGETVDVNTKKKYIKPFRQAEYKPLTDYGG